MMRFLSLSLFLIFQSVFSQNIVKKRCLLMGVQFEFLLVAKDSITGKHYVQEAIKEAKRIEALISSWDSNSQTSTVNRNAGIRPVHVGKELFDLIQRSQKVSELTQGSFDISFASIDNVWDFKKKITQVPSEAIVQKSVQKINYKNIFLDAKNQTVFLKEKGMKIGFGAIGKGFVAEKIKAKLKKMGVASGLINASGDITTWGEHPQNDTWEIAIKTPFTQNDFFAHFKIKNSSVVTSGNYEKYITINGEHYTHIINPKTGWPVKGLKSVTIFCDNAELSDALATSVFVMGADKGIQLINRLKNIEALLVTDQDKLITSKTLKTKND